MDVLPATQRSTALALPTARELEALTPTDRWNLEDALDEAQDTLREFNDEELRRWVEKGKTQTWIAKQVGRSQQRISQRCSALGIKPKDGRGTFTRASKNDEEPEVVEGEVVEEEAPESAIPRPRPPVTAADLFRRELHPAITAVARAGEWRQQKLHYLALRGFGPGELSALRDQIDQAEAALVALRGDVDRAEARMADDDSEPSVEDEMRAAGLDPIPERGP